jgi:hypothetical protein
MTISFVKRIALSVLLRPRWQTRLTGIRDVIGEKKGHFDGHTQANGIACAYNVPRTDQPALAVSVQH